MTIRMYDLAGAEDGRRFSPHCWRTRMALAHKGLAVETVPWRFTEQAAIAALGSKTVPVIVDGDHTVADSWQIACYLEEHYPDRPALFDGAPGSALFMQNWTNRVILPLLARMVTKDIHDHLAAQDQGYFRTSREARFKQTLEQFCADWEAVLPTFRKALEPLRATLGAQAYVAGDQPAYVDYIVFSGFQWARVISPLVLLEDGDPVADWRGRMLELFDGLAANAIGYAP